MTKRPFFFIAIIVMLVSCQKKKTGTNTYICDRYHEVNSDLEVLAIPTYLYSVDTLRDQTDAQVTLYEQTHNTYDTVKLSHDTLIIVHQWSVCNED